MGLTSSGKTLLGNDIQTGTEQCGGITGPGSAADIGASEQEGGGGLEKSTPGSLLTKAWREGQCDWNTEEGQEHGVS